MEGGRPSLVVAFTARDGTRQGLVWIDEATKRILRLRTDLLNHTEGGTFNTFTRDVRFVPVNFPAYETTLWLPGSASVDARFARGEAHSVHRFSDYRVDGFENHNDAANRKRDTGEAAAAVGLEEDGIELLVKGMAALKAGKPEDAVAPLREATARLAERTEPGYYLGLALYATHDLTGAEVQFRETVKRSPGMGAAHNELGAVLFARGDKSGAVTEFQQALRLEPGNAKMAANLDAAIRAPAEKTPATAGASRSSVTGTPTIQVDVRQVLVPVVVTDREGHHVTGLRPGDFKVFEDGVEQKITAFSSERGDISASARGGAASGQRDRAATGSPASQQQRRTYVICLDMIHASFSNFARVREALQQLFQQEQSGDSQYVVIALGRTMEVVQKATPDPAKVLETLRGPNFLRLFEMSQSNVSRSEISDFQVEVQEVRGLCEIHDPNCEIRKQPLPLRADALAEREKGQDSGISGAIPLRGRASGAHWF